MLNCFNILFVKIKSIFKNKHSENMFEDPKIMIIHDNALNDDWLIISLILEETL